MSARLSILAVIIGVIAAATLVASSYSTQSASPSVIRFNGVVLNTTYFNGYSQIFGPATQNACNETLPHGPQWPTFGPTCPSHLFGGTSYDLQFFVTGNPGTTPGLWVNLTVTAPFDFEVNPGTAAWIPTVQPNSTGLFVGGGNQLFDSGTWWGWALVFTFPQSFTPSAEGLWLHATLTVQPTNQIYGP